MTREDLNPGAQIAQSCHVVSSFMQEHADIAKEWMENSNYIAVLASKDEQALLSLIERAKKKGVKFSIFVEPDLNNALTAVALEPCPDSKKLCSSFRLALKNK